MIRNVVFDMGQVMIRWDGWEFLERLAVPPEDRETLFRELFRGTEWTELDRGTLGEAVAIEAVCARLPQHLHGYVDKMISHWWELPMLPVEGMAELVEELKGAGYGIYLLSNANLHLPEYFVKIPGHEFFDGMIVSAQWKLLKPEREIYQALFQTYGLIPDECFFVDDVNANVEAARRCGMHGTVFHGDAARLRREMAGAGIPVRQI